MRPAERSPAVRAPLILLLVASGWLGGAETGGAWGPTGHRVLAQVATDRLSATALQESRRLLGSSLVEASTWADDVRDDPRWQWLDPYHYVNLDPSVGRFQGCPARGCVVEGIEGALERLADPSLREAQRAIALRQLVHLVGDLHQPLHVSHAEDRGGNDVEVEWFGEPSNPHWVWDTGIVREALGRSWRRIAEQIEAGLAQETAADWEAGSVVDWTHESYRLSVDVVYPSVGDERSLGRSYAAEHADLVATQLARAGVRLASLLNRIWP
jgi:hypothetical protein